MDSQERNVAYLSVEDVLRLRDQLAADHGESYEILRFQQLLSALASPQMAVFGEELFPNLCAKAGQLLSGLIRNHPFWDGNKRIALAATRLFLQRNGYALTVAPAEADAFTTSIATGASDSASAAAWIKQWSQPI